MISCNGLANWNDTAYAKIAGLYHPCSLIGSESRLGSTYVYPRRANFGWPRTYMTSPCGLSRMNNACVGPAPPPVFRRGSFLYEITHVLRAFRAERITWIAQRLPGIGWLTSASSSCPSCNPVSALVFLDAPANAQAKGGLHFLLAEISLRCYTAFVSWLGRIQRGLGPYSRTIQRSSSEVSTIPLGSHASPSDRRSVSVYRSRACVDRVIGATI